MSVAAQIEGDCGECRGRHTYFLSNADFFDGVAEYEYTCPTTGSVARMTAGENWGQVVPARSAAAVDVRKV